MPKKVKSKGKPRYIRLDQDLEFEIESRIVLYGHDFSYWGNFFIRKAIYEDLPYEYVNVLIRQKREYVEAMDKKIKDSQKKAVSDWLNHHLDDYYGAVYVDPLDDRYIERIQKARRMQEIAPKTLDELNEDINQHMQTMPDWFKEEFDRNYEEYGKKIEGRLREYQKRLKQREEWERLEEERKRQKEEERRKREEKKEEWAEKVKQTAHELKTQNPNMSWEDIYKELEKTYDFREEFRIVDIYRLRDEYEGRL